MSHSCTPQAACPCLCPGGAFHPNTFPHQRLCLSSCVPLSRDVYQALPECSPSNHITSPPWCVTARFLSNVEQTLQTCRHDWPAHKQAWWECFQGRCCQADLIVKTIRNSLLSHHPTVLTGPLLGLGVVCLLDLGFFFF